MKAKYIQLYILFSFSFLHINAQELFPLSEPASSVPKGVIGVRTHFEYYKQGQVLRYMAASRVMYGVTSKLTAIVSLVGSNHHYKTFRESFWINHSHYYTIPSPFLVNGAHLYAKYRLLSIDGEKSHFRVAMYAEGSWVRATHDEAEPNLYDDNSGYGGGIITTYLKNHFAVSFTGGIIKPITLKGKVLDPIPSLPYVPIRIEYKPAYIFDLSFGYLLFPRKYKYYSQPNWNIYIELKGRSYPSVDIYVGNPVRSTADPVDYYGVNPKSTPYLQAGTYIDANYGLQCIVHSNLRIDFTVGTPLINRSLVHNYPYFQIGLQRYFY